MSNLQIIDNQKLFGKNKVLLYKPNTIKVVPISEELENMLDKNLISPYFPDYKYIIYEFVNFILKRKLFSDETWHIIVKNTNPLAKGHFSEDDYIELFNIDIYFQLRGKTLITDIADIIYNINLISEYITLTGGTEVKEPNYDNHPVENVDHCSICLEHKGDFVETPCKHQFHLSCLRRTPNLDCLLCKRNLKDFLKSQGVSENFKKF